MKVLVSKRTNFPYLPGIPGYGQQGAKGNTGDSGNGIYYASYTISGNENYAKEQILSNKLLSDNLDQQIDSSYTPQDIIIDNSGNIYQLNSSLDLVAYITNSSLYSIGNIIAPFNSLVVRNITSFTETTDTYSFLQTNIKQDSVFDGIDLSFLLPKFRRYASTQIAGNWLYFYVEPAEGTETSLFSYTFTVVLPDGTALHTTTSTNFVNMFIDNYYFYACTGVGELLADYIDFSQGLRSGIETENSSEVSSIIAEFISNYCKFYVDIKSEDTGLIYRLRQSESILNIENYIGWTTQEYTSEINFFNAYNIAQSTGTGIDNLEHNFTYLDTQTLNNNTVLRLYFMSLSSMKIRIKINKYNKSGVEILPAVKVYVSNVMSGSNPALTTYTNTETGAVEVNNIMHVFLADGYEVYEWDGSNPQLVSNNCLDGAEALINLDLSELNLSSDTRYFIDFGVTYIEVDDTQDQSPYHTTTQPEVTITIEDFEILSS